MTGIRRALLGALLASACFATSAHADDVPGAGAPLAAWPGPDVPVAVETGKTVFVVTCSSQGIGCVRAANGVTEAGQAFGWTVQITNGRGDPGAWNGVFLGAAPAGPSRFNPWGTIAAVYVLAAGIAGLQQLGAAFYVDQFFNGGALLLAIAASRYMAVRRGRPA